jgi:UDP-glucose 6-dehydrogenase
MDLAAASQDYFASCRFATSTARPTIPQTNGARERVHEKLKARLNLLVSTNPEVLRPAMAVTHISTTTSATTTGSARSRRPMCLTAGGR